MSSHLQTLPTKSSSLNSQRNQRTLQGYLLCLFQSLPYLTVQTEWLMDLLTILYKMFPNAKIVGHRDLPGTTPKSCPCFNAHEVFGYIENL